MRAEEADMSRKVTRIGCRDCRVCSRDGITDATVRATRATTALATAGFSSILLASRKKCGQCGHPVSAHEK